MASHSIVLAIFMVMALTYQSEAMRRSMEFADMASEDQVKAGASTISKFSEHTILRFKLPPASTSLAEVSNRTKSWELTEAQKAANWNLEWDIYMEEPVVRKFWSRSVTTPDAEGYVRDKVDAIKRREIPGIPGLTIGDAFHTLSQNGCPLWILGGAVRDLIAGGDASDVDTALLCRTEKLEEIARDYGWQVNAYHKYQYFSLGTPHHDDGVEGKHISAGYVSAFKQEWAVNMLLYSVSTDKVIDPMGFGVEDAKKKKLTPATPSSRVYEEVEGYETTTWDLWRMWVEAQQPPSMARHVRYLKMRARGWQPKSDCVRFFMANEYVIASQLENQDVQLGTKVEFNREDHTVWPAGTLKFIAELVGKADRADKKKTAFKYFQQIRYDLSKYFNDNGNDCNDYGAVAKDRTKQKYPGQVLGFGLVHQCKRPSRAAEEVMDSCEKCDFDSVCEYLTEFQKQK